MQTLTNTGSATTTLWSTVQQYMLYSTPVCCIYSCRHKQVNKGSATTIWLSLTWATVFAQMRCVHVHAASSFRPQKRGKGEEEEGDVQLLCAASVLLGRLPGAAVRVFAEAKVCGCGLWVWV